jgi:hypothetical protein
MKHGFSKMIFLGAIAAWQLSAGACDYRWGYYSWRFPLPVGNPAYLGVTLQTPAGGPWNNSDVQLFFRHCSPTSGLPTTPAAAGTLYLLSSELYSACRLRAALSASDPCVASHRLQLW